MQRFLGLACNQSHFPRLPSAGHPRPPLFPICHWAIGACWSGGYGGTERSAILACSLALLLPWVALCVWGNKWGRGLSLVLPTSPTTHPLFSVHHQAMGTCQPGKKDWRCSVHFTVTDLVVILVILPLGLICIITLLL